MTTEQELLHVGNDVRSIGLSIDFAHQADEDLLDSWLSERVLRERRTFRREAKWHTKCRLADLPEGALFGSSISSRREIGALAVRGLVAEVRIESDDTCTLYLYGERFSAGDFEAAIAQLKGWLEPSPDEASGRVTVGFRYVTARCFRYRERSIEAPAWDQINANYAALTREMVSGLISGFEPGMDGRVLLFHGPPGTGKTYVIRALSRHWAPWCRFEYITDPEKFFGDADYMMHVLIEGHRDGDDQDEDETGERWRVLVLEDAGELLARDAKLREGQGLSRLLNFGEGLIGQGLNVLTLITTNEHLATLNEAVARPGRTAAEIEFHTLDPAECNAWLAQHDPQRRSVTEAMTLAELYAFVAGRRPQAPKKPAIGFRR